jgi:hypothetical protein
MMMTIKIKVWKVDLNILDTSYKNSSATHSGMREYELERIKEKEQT